MLNPARDRPTALSLRGIARRFGRRWALRGVTLDVAPGEIVTVMGRNGSGKTTLLRIVATALRPTRGQGSVFGADLVRSAGAVRERIGLLGHAPGLYDDLTAEENLQFALRMFGAHPDERAVAAALERAGLTGEARSRVREFSSGMRRRLALARLLLRPPRLLLLDEPYASFDAEGIERINDCMAQVRGAGGAVLIASHDAQRAAELADRVVELEAGRLLDSPAAAAAAGAWGT